MKVTCQACSAQYTIADDKVKGRKVKIRCKACQSPIVVDGQNPPPETGTGMSEPPPALDPFAPETALAPDAEVWNVNLSDTDSRTMTTAEVLDAFRAGIVSADAFVWKDGMTDWVPIMDCVELAPLLAGPTDPPAPVGVPTPMAPVVAPAAARPVVAGMPLFGGPEGGGAITTAARAASSKAQAGADLFGDIEVAGAESDDVDTSARGVPVLPGSSAYDDKPTGQRNENSVLFSLDSMKAGFAASPAPAAPGKPAPSRPGAPRPAQPSNPDDPFGMGASAGIAGLGAGGNPLFSLNANQALLTAPAPPEPKPVAPVDFGVPAMAPANYAADKKKQQLVVVGAAAVILLLLGLLVFGGNRETEGEVAASAAKSAASAKEAAAPPKVEEKKEEPVAVKAEEAKPDEKKPEEKAVAKAEPAKTGGKSAGKKPEEAPAAATTTAPFSKASAISALSGAAGQAGSCKKPGGPTGSGKVQVTFAPSGRVTTATIMGGPFAGTPVGGCVSGAFRRAKVPAFAGNPVTVSKSFQIN